MSALGVVVVILAIGVSIMVHEAGHMLAAKAFGMKVTEFFVGFGTRLWSFRRGETEYGVKAIPAGGYVRIVGMSPGEEVLEEDQRRAFYRFPAWRRVVVLSAGSATHLVMAFLALAVAAALWGVPSTRPVLAAVEPCAVPSITYDQPVPSCTPADPKGPAVQAGLAAGDRVVAVDGRSVTTQDELLTAVRANVHSTPMTLTVERDGARRTVQVTPVPVLRPDPADQTRQVTVGALGVTLEARQPVGVIGAAGQSVHAMGSLISQSLSSIASFPGRIPGLVHALFGGTRAADSPVSLVGVAQVGGQAVAAHDLSALFVLFAIFNVFLAIFNMLPLLPLDGGHVAVVLFEKARSVTYRLLRRPDPGRVDVTKLMPVALVVIAFFGGLTVLAVLADIVNPVANPFQ